VETLDPCRLSKWNAPKLLFPATVALGYLSGLLDGLSLRHWPGIASAGCAVLYCAIGMIDYRALDLRQRHLRCAAYFAVQVLLLAGIIGWSRMDGQMWLCVMPLAAVAVLLLTPGVAAAAVALLYAGTIACGGYFYGTGSLFPNALSLFCAFAFVALFTRVAIREASARHRAEILAEEVEALAVIQERNRMAREIHDSLGHFLTTIHVQLEAARTVHAADPARALAAVAKAEALAGEALAEVRRSVSALYADRSVPPLPARLAELVSAAEGGGTAIALEVLGAVRPLAPQTEHALFRAAQEGLTNVRKHAQARTAGLTLDFRDPRQVVFRVSDDGRGPAGGTPGHGLAGLADRIGQVGGRVATDAPPGGGFILLVEIPA
jgi:signal transduction histidine kinase